jgi:hypothetical protein
MVHATEVERVQPAADNSLFQLCEAPRRTPVNLLSRGYIEKSLRSCDEKRRSDEPGGKGCVMTGASL